MLRRTPLLPLALLLAIALAPVASAQTLTRNDTHRLRATGKVGTRTFEATASLVAPADWKRVGAPSRTRLRLRAPGTELCTWTFTFTTRVFIGADRPAAEVVLGRAPGDARYELDRGTRGEGAWRVVRLVAEQELTGSRIDPVAGAAPKGQRLWREIAATAEAGDDDECHSGTYRDFAGPRLGDVLAVAKGRAFV